jgi:hypothetical protein
MASRWADSAKNGAQVLVPIRCALHGLHGDLHVAHTRQSCTTTLRNIARTAAVTCNTHQQQHAQLKRNQWPRII